MTIRSPLDSLKWLRDQHDHPSQSWYRLCLSLARQAHNADSLYRTAYSAWLNSHEQHPLTVEVDWHTVPRGAPIFYKGKPFGDGIIYGHVATYWGSTPNKGPLCWSNDVVVEGKINLVSPLWFISHWGHELLGWTGDINGQDLGLTIPGPPPPPPDAVSISQVQAAAKADPDRPGGGRTPGAGLDVLRVENALVKLGYLDERYKDGSFGTATIAAYRRWQTYLGYQGAGADGIPGPISLRRLGHKFGFRVVK